MDDEPRIPLSVAGQDYILAPQAVRVSLSDGPPALWGLQVHVLRDGELVGVKTCFVGRVTLHLRAPEALDGPIDGLLPTIHEVLTVKIRERIEAGEPGDEIVFA